MYSIFDKINADLANKVGEDKRHLSKA